MSIGERIAEERKRMGLSQSAFAELVGISFSSQRRYESGSRDPDTSYLDSLRKNGVDVQYVMTGRVKQTAKGYDADTLAEFGLAIAKRYQISPEELQCLQRDVSDAMEGEEDPGSVEMWAIEQRVASYEATFFVHAIEFFERRLKSTLLTGASELDSSLLANILIGVDSELSAQGKSLEPNKRAQTVAMLYRAFRGAGKIDTDVLAEAVVLAAS